MDSGGFFDLYELATTRETARQNAHVGRFPWCRMTIMRMVKRGDFPPPVKLAGSYKNVWRKEDIFEFEKK